MYNLMKRVIDAGKRTGTLNVEDITIRLDTFFAVGKLSLEEYTELTALLTEHE